MVVAARDVAHQAKAWRKTLHLIVNQKNVPTVPRVVTVALAKSVRVKRSIHAAIKLLIPVDLSAATMAAKAAKRNKLIDRV